MSFPIDSVGAVMPSLPTSYLQAADGPGRITGATEAGAGSGFGAVLGGAVDNVHALESDSRRLAVDAVTGDLEDLHAATIASAQASVALETITTFRNRGVEAFNEIMRMQA